VSSRVIRPGEEKVTKEKEKGKVKVKESGDGERMILTTMSLHNPNE